MQPPQRALLRKPVQPAPRPSGAVLVHRQIALADRDTCYLPRIDGSREIPYDILTPAALVSRSVIGQGVLLREKDCPAVAVSVIWDHHGTAVRQIDGKWKPIAGGVVRIFKLSVCLQAGSRQGDLRITCLFSFSSSSIVRSCSSSSGKLMVHSPSIACPMVSSPHMWSMRNWPKCSAVSVRNRIS